ncbi:hypothetical protein HY968_02040 [Candidatus Kaiserbacteria bacterium]|nr:hypothetical protein [Candidatus Kaiserbacteria bacterium]
MPPDSSGPLGVQHSAGASQLLAMAGILVMVLLGFGAWYWYVQNNAVPATHADFYKKLSVQNISFADAEKLSGQLRFAEALPLYQTALQSATNDDERLQIKLLIARATVQTGAYMQAVLLLKEIVATRDNPRASRGRAAAVEEIADLYQQGNPDLNREIFNDEPFKSLQVANQGGVTLRRLHEYAASIYPLAISELRIAQWYALQLPQEGKKSKLSAETIQEYRTKIGQLVSAADRDVSYLRQNSAMIADLRYALLVRAIVVGVLNRKGDTSLGDANEQFVSAIDAYATAGPGQDGIARYYYALFIAQTYGASKKEDIRAVLAPLSSEEYANAPVKKFLMNARTPFYGVFPTLLAGIDPDFKKFLMTLGWTESDFSS